MSSQTLIIANPIAGRGLGRQYARRLRRALIRLDQPAEICLKPPAALGEDDFAAITALVCIGGDGTLRAVAQQCHRITGKILPLYPLPLGTANLMCRHLAMDLSRVGLIERAAEAIQAGHTRTLDALHVNGSIALLMAGIGLDGQIVHEMQRVRTGPINYASYAFPALLAFQQYEYNRLTVSVDGRLVFAEAPAVAFVANVPEYGTGFPVVPGAVSDDGLLDVCVLPVRSPAAAMQQAMRVAVGEHLRGEDAVSVRGKHVQIVANNRVAVQVDGDAAGFTPLQIDLLPMIAPFIVKA